MAAGPLGRLVPPDWEHVAKYPLSARLAEPAPPVGVPVVLGISWYEAFDEPVKIGNRWWIGRHEDGSWRDLGEIRGGHAIAVLGPQLDQWGWYRFYDQQSGSCTGFSGSRMMSLLNRRRYDGYWLWDRAKERDVWNDTKPGDEEGSSVRAAFDALRELGHVRVKRGQIIGPWDDDEDRYGFVPALEDGIAANRWATNPDEVLAALNVPLYAQLEAVPLLNSWGRSYPHKAWLPLRVLERLLNEDGECGVPTDR